MPDRWKPSMEIISKVPRRKTAFHDIMAEAPSYFKIFDGQEAKLSDIERESPDMVHAINSLEKMGVVGRRAEGEEIIIFPKFNATRE